MNLEALLGETTPKSFFEEYWGKKPLLLKRHSPGFYRNIFTLADVDSVLFSARFRPGEYRIANEPEGIDLQFQSVRMENPSAPAPLTDFFRAFNQGQSIVLHGLDRRWEPMGRVAAELARVTGGHVTANLYMTPAAQQAYPLHYDSHDFFIFQFHGRKHWRVYAPGGKQHPIRNLPPASDHDWRDGALLLEFDLEDGDFLYIPRGYPHEVVALDEISLHVTVGLHALNGYWLAGSALRRLASTSENLRSSIMVQPGPNGAIHRPDLSVDVQAIVQAGLDIQAGVTAWRDAIAESRDPLPDGHFASLERLADLAPTNRIRRRPGPVADVQLDQGRVRLKFSNEVFVRPAEVHAAVEYLAQAKGDFPISAIPGLPTDAEKLNLVRDLTRIGFLTILPSPASLSGEPNVQPSNTPSVAAMPPEASVTPQQPSGTCGCQACQGQVQTAPTPSFVYAIGKISARFPSIDIEKELAQVMRSTDTASLTDQQVLHQILSQPENAYLAREMCWVFSAQGLESFIVVPRSGIELSELIQALGLGASEGATTVIVGTRGPQMPAAACAGLSLPAVIASKVYAFKLDELVRSLPLQENELDAGRELLNRITHLIDNVGDIDEHRAVNYLALRYPAMYGLVIDNYRQDRSLQGLTVRKVSTNAQRRLIDVQFSFVNRKTDVRDLFAARVDVTGMFPFLVTPLRAVFDKDA